MLSGERGCFLRGHRNLPSEDFNVVEQ